MRVSVRQAPTTLHPSYTFDANTQRIAYSLFEGLTRVGLDQKIHMGLADSVQVSSDKCLYTFTLKKTSWSNGEPVSAEDFAYAWKKAISKGSTAQYGHLFYCIKHAREANEGKLPIDSVGIKVLNHRQLQVELDQPVPYFLYLLSNPVFAPICRSVDLKDPSWFQKEGLGFVCNGPFCLRMKKEDSIFVLGKNPYYYEKEAVHLDELHFFITPDSNTAFLMYEKGEVDWYGEPLVRTDTEIIQKLLEQDCLEIQPIGSINWGFCNTAAFPWHSKNIRKAISCVIDRKDLVDHILLGQKPAASFVPETLTKLEKENFIEGKDLERAQAYFEEGLKELNLTREQFPILCLSYMTSNPWTKAFVQSLQEQLRNTLGIQTTLQGEDYNACLDKLKKGDFQFVPVAWSAYFPDPVFHLETFKEDSENNWTRWKHDAFQELVLCADQESDPVKRDDYLRRAEKILVEEMPLIPLSYQTARYVKSKKVKNLLITDLGGIDFKWVSLEGSPKR